jgi:hypothetical protein
MGSFRPSTMSGICMSGPMLTSRIPQSANPRSASSRPMRGPELDCADPASALVASALFTWRTLNSVS